MLYWNNYSAVLKVLTTCKILCPESSLFMNPPVNQENRFIELYNQYSDDIFRFCMLRLRDRERALDVTQDVFFKLWNEYLKNPARVSSIQNMKAFIFTIARNTLIDATRKKKSTPFSFLTDKFSDDVSSIEPVEFQDSTIDIEQRQEISEVVGYLDLLDPHHRELLTFKFIHDMSIADIADVLQISENATSVRLHRALEHARKKLSFLYE